MERHDFLKVYHLHIGKLPQNCVELPDSLMENWIEAQVYDESFLLEKSEEPWIDGLHIDDWPSVE